MKKFLITLGIAFFSVATPATANDWAKNINIFVHPSRGVGVTVSGLGNDVYFNVLKNDRFSPTYVEIGTQISTRKVRTPPWRKGNKKPTVTVGVGK